MLIQHIEITNFRKLLAVRIDLAPQTTVFVGANNSGKTSAMLAMRRFLVPKQSLFSVHDITLSHWEALNAIGQAWLTAHRQGNAPDLDEGVWSSYLPTLDIWLNVPANELHYVSKLVPTLDWTEGLLGLRLRLEPDNVTDLCQAFIEAMVAADTVRTSVKDADEQQPSLTLWPNNMMDFLGRRLSRHLRVRAYPLDPQKLVTPENSVAKPQALPQGMPSVDDPLAGLIRVNEIPAQRGFGEALTTENVEESALGRPSGRLSEQLRAYYRKHLDPSEHPDVNDIAALQAIEAAQAAFDERLTASFKVAFTEVEGMGYPGVTDPRPRVSTRLRPLDGLNHQAAVSFEIDMIQRDGEIIPVMRLPEDNNGLGYQNLISMIFRLMSFRDAWMRVGKAEKESGTTQFEPLHLILIEEPEAHLHAQVQQVFIKKAYDVLRAHNDLGQSTILRTQLLVSTHSSHVTHETPYSCLRYFRRLPAGMNGVPIPISVVINLTDAFGESDETTRFVTRYLRTQHADLFFADALILVEGPAERMLLPHFIRRAFPLVNQGYITLLEVGGSHAHRLKPLVHHLGLITLVITDLDAQVKKIIPAEGEKEEKVKLEPAQPRKGEDQTTNNDTIRLWWPMKTAIDDLLADEINKTLKGDDLFGVRVAYQTSIVVRWPVTAETTQTAYPYTFEDALAFENMEFFASLPGPGLAAKFRNAIGSSDDTNIIGRDLFLALRSGEKAPFALNILDAKNFDELKVPSYIAEGLSWLETQIKKKHVEVLSTEVGVTK